MEIDFDKVNSDELITVRTNNSRYYFSVVDPEERRGRLSGGSLGDAERDAVFVASLGQEVGDSSVPGKIMVGSRAMFYLTARNGMERLITSPVAEVRRRPRDGGERRAA